MWLKFEVCSEDSHCAAGLKESGVSIGLQVPKDPHFLWVTEFPLFTRADADKEFLAHGRWSSSHHPFTAPMYEDIEKMLAKDVEDVSHSSASRFHQSDSF